MAETLAGQRILVVEDESIIALAIEDMLTELECEVIGPAMTLEAAEELARDQRLDAAVLDINLSGNSSHPVAQQLRDRGVPFCFSTGYASGDVGEDFVGVPVLQKPYDTKSLGRVLRQLLG